MSMTLFLVTKDEKSKIKMCFFFYNPIKFILKAYLKTNSKSIDKNLQNKGQK